MSRVSGRARSIHRRLEVGLLAAVIGSVGLLFAAPSVAVGATFIVGGCSYSTIIADIEAANDEPTYPGGDTIELHPGCTYILSARYDGTHENALPPITSDVIILGHGARIEMASGADARSFFDVDSAGSLLLSDVTLAQAARTIRNDGSLTLSNVTITHAIPLNSGPAINNTGVLAVISSTIENQSCLGCEAGAIYNVGSATITDSTISGGAGTEAIDNNRGTAAIYGSTISDNTDGAIYNTGYLEVHGSSFVDNQTDLRGAAIQTTLDSDLWVDTSYFGGNLTSLEGGAIYVGSEAIAQVVNSTFYNNHVGSRFFPCCVGGTGGAIASHHSLRVEHVTFARNGAGDGADVASPDGLASVEASVFASPRAGLHCSGNIADFGANVTDSITGCPSTFTVGNAQLTGPAVHGFGTKTLALGADSAAFDAVSTTGCPSYDQRGVARPQGAACDAGAFEDQRPGVPGAPALGIFWSSPNQGTFTLIWSAGTDPDGTSPGYRLYRKDANDAHYTEVSTPTGASDSRVGEPEGTFTYEVASDDGNMLSSKSAASAPVVVDHTPPSAPDRKADRSPESSPWFRDTVTVTFFGSTDPDLPDGSAGSGVASITAPETFTTSGSHTVTGTATDAAGNVSQATSATVRVDAEDPSVGFTTCPSDVILKSTTSLAWSATDPSSGISGATSGSVPLDTSTIGTRTATITVSDLVGHPATASCAYRVIYDFQGFFAPLSNTAKLIDVKAGDIVPVAFGLSGDQGLAVIAAGFPQSAQTSCTSPGSLGSGLATVASRPLEYSKVNGGRYRYSWATSKSWAGTCRQLIVTLADGTVHRANLHFK
jgi:hypothetical protein